jgi:hypothetical protein
MTVDSQFRQKLLIDKNDLDGELMEQSQVFFDVAHQFSLAVSKRDRAKEQVSRVAAKVAHRLRKDAEEHGEKITEAAISRLIDLEDDYQNAVDEYIDLCAEANDLLAMKEAFQQRSYMLKDLVALYLSQYYMSDSVKGDHNRIASAEHSSNRAKINSQRKRVVLDK